MTAKTSDPLVTPVTAQELADYAVLDAADPAISSILTLATDAVIQFLGYDLTPRDWTLTLWEWPIVGTRTAPNLSRSPYSFKREIELPYAALISVSSVTSYGETVTDYTERESSMVMPRGLAKETYKDNDDPAIVVEYNAGLSPIPEAVKQSILVLASYLYEHRGACDVTDALGASGATRLLRPHAKAQNVVAF